MSEGTYPGILHADTLFFAGAVVFCVLVWTLVVSALAMHYASGGTVSGDGLRTHEEQNERTGLTMGEEPNVWRVLGAKLDKIAEEVASLKAERAKPPEEQGQAKIAALEKDVAELKAEAEKLKALAPPGWF